MFVLNGLKAARINLISFTLGILILTGLQASSQEPIDSFALDDQTFVEIELTPEGVIALDSDGNPWSWDFNTESFKPGRGNWRTPDRAETDLPIEIRATVEKFISDNDKRVVIKADEYVKGDIITSGSVTVRGWARGSIRSNKWVLVSESGQVDGNIRAPKVTIKDGAEVSGVVDESDLLTDIPEIFTETISMAGLWVLFGFTVFLVVVGSLIISLMPIKLQRLSDCATRFPTRSFLVGLLFTFLMPMVAILVAITVIGLVVVWAVPIVYLIAFFTGIVIVGRDTGNKLLVRLTGRKGTDIIAYLTGLATLMILWFVVAILMGSSDEVAFGFGVFFLVIAILVSCYPIMTGVGVAFLTRFGLRDYVMLKEQFTQAQQTAAAPAPPPIPNGHPGFGAEPSGDDSSSTNSGPVPPPLNIPPAIFPPSSDQDETDR